MTNYLVLLFMVMATDGEKLSLKSAVVHRPANAAEQEAFAALPNIALIAEKPQQSLLKLARQVTDAHAKVPWAKPIYLLAAGPILDGPDRAQVHELTKQDGKITLRIRHTSARLSGATLRRNIQWRPLVQVPIELSPGKWDVIVEWSPYSDLPAGKPLGKPTTDTAQIDVVEARAK